MFILPGGSSPPEVTLTFTDSAVTSGLSSTHTFTGKAIGTAASDRRVVVVVSLEGAASLTSVTIGGNTATADYVFAGAASLVGFYSYNLTTGITADIVVTVGALTYVGIGVYALYGANATPSDTAGSNTNPNPSNTINVVAGGCAISAVEIRSNTNRTVTWTGLTEEYDAVVGNNDDSHSGAADQFPTAQTGLTVQATPSGSVARNTLGIIAYEPV